METKKKRGNAGSYPSNLMRVLKEESLINLLENCKQMISISRESCVCVRERERERESVCE